MARTAQNSSHLPLEEYVNAVEQQGGVYTNYPVVVNNSTHSTTIGETVVTLTATATISLDPTTGGVFKLTPAQSETINAASVPAIGQYITLVVTTSGTTSYTLTFGTNFKSTGTLATGTTSAKVFTVTFVSDGVSLNEVSRTTAM